MNNDKIIAILHANEERIAEALVTADVTDESYVRLLNHIGMGRNLASAIANQPNPFGEPTEENCDRNASESEAPASNIVPFPTPEERAADPENAEEASEAARVEPAPAPHAERAEADPHQGRRAGTARSPREPV